MTYYTEPTSNDTAGIFELFRYINNTANGLFFPSMLLVIWVVIFIGTKQFSTSRAWTSSSAMCSFLSIPLAILGFINPLYMYMLFLFTAGGLLWLRLEK